MKFTEFTIHSTTEGSELVADILWNYTNYGVAISDVKDVISLQNDKVMYWDYIEENLLLESEVLIKAFIPLEDTQKIAPKIREDLEQLAKNSQGVFSIGTLETTLREVEGDDWLEIWRKHFRPIHIGQRVVVVPEWIEYTPKEGEVTVILDSNMAFGTGEHETTSMCLDLLQQYLKPSDTCIDVGCGSGILGIAAVKLGAEKAYLTDIDSIAVKSATHNSIKNGVDQKTVVSLSDLLNDATIKGDIMLANITAEILCRLAPTIPKNLKKGGILILSGIIESRLDLVLKTFTAQNLVLDKKIQKGEWFALAFRG